jgi:hypothetical protein
MLYVSGVNEGDQGGGSKGKLGEGWGQRCASWGRLTCSMGPEWMGTHIHAPYIKILHVKTHSLISNIVQYLSILYIFLLCSLKINHMKEL